MARWMGKAKQHDPPAQIESVESLAGSVPGVVQIVAPGPSYEHLDVGTTIGVNSALELRDVDFWLFQEGTLAKRFHRLYTVDRRCDIVTTETRAAHIQRLVPPEKTIWSYVYREHKVLHRKSSLPEEWRKHEGFLPGHCTVSANALSLAVLMGAALILLVGVDLATVNEVYYADGVKRNPGPRNRHRALCAGRSWMRKAAKRGVWSGPRIISTSTTIRLPGVERVSTAEAIDIAKEVESCQP